MKYAFGLIFVLLGLGACSDAAEQSAARKSVSAEIINDDIPNLDNATLNTDNLITPAMTEAEKAAMDLFAYQEGVWDSTWTWFDEAGNVTNTMTGTETFSYLTDKHSQMLTNVVPGLKQTSYAMLAFNPARQHIIFLNIGPKGDYWVMRLNPLTGVMISDPHLNADGTETILMFTTVRQTPDLMDIQLTTSADGGETWNKGYLQTLTRKTYDDADEE